MFFESLLIIVFAKCVFVGWKRYRNSYFLKVPAFLWIDGIIISLLLPTYQLIKVFSLIDSTYFITISGSLCLLIVVTYAIAWIKTIKGNSLPENTNNASELSIDIFSDEPINEEKEDLIGRKKFANSLKDHICNLSFKESFVMALYGRWGEGKTSILNFLKKDIRKENKMFLYEFDPWFFGNENALTINFYLGLEDLLQERFFIPKSIKNVFKFYPEVLIKGFVALSLRSGNSKIDDRPAELKKKIEDFVSSLDRRVLVVIDDLDRLQKNEILAVFRLIKLTSHIKNMVFLLSFDYSKVISVIKDTEKMIDPQGYIEKIVQLPIHLPMTDQRKIDQFLLFSFPDIEYKSEIDKFFDRLHLTDERRKEFDDNFANKYNTDLKQIFSTYRAAKRYLNSIFFRLPFIEREVHLYDFFILEVFHTFFPMIYADMEKSPWYYVSPWSLEFLYYSPWSRSDNEKYKIIKEHIEQLVENVKNENEKLVIKSLLEDIFPEVKNAFLDSGLGKTNYSDWARDYRINKRIAHPESFLKYFMLGIREGVIPDAEFEDMIIQWGKSASLDEEIKLSLFDKYQRQNKLVDLLQRLKLHSSTIEGKLVLPLIRVIYKNCSKLRREGDMWETEYNHAEGLTFRLLEDNKAILDNQIQEILKEIVEKTKCYNFVSLVVLSCNEERGTSLYRVHKNVKPEELRKIFSKRLREYFIDGKKNIFDEYSREGEFVFILYQWATQWGDKNKTRQDEVTDYLIDIFKKNPKKAGLFLRYHVRDNFGLDKSKHFDYKEFVAAYDPEKFFNCLTELGEKAYSIQSEKEAIDFFLKTYSDAAQKNVSS